MDERRLRIGNVWVHVKPGLAETAINGFAQQDDLVTECNTGILALARITSVNQEHALAKIPCFRIDLLLVPLRSATSTQVTALVVVEFGTPGTASIQAEPSAASHLVVAVFKFDWGELPRHGSNFENMHGINLVVILVLFKAKAVGKTSISIDHDFDEVTGNNLDGWRLRNRFCIRGIDGQCLYSADAARYIKEMSVRGGCQRPTGDSRPQIQRRASRLYVNCLHVQ